LIVNAEAEYTSLKEKGIDKRCFISRGLGRNRIENKKDYWESKSQSIFK
jgi:hypothetical protein